ncbi:MAG: hypothetical protein PHT07_15410 [Paludibacter sp.]|nr:hypothetical protein [Paludibacter sp.]
MEKHEQLLNEILKTEDELLTLHGSNKFVKKLMLFRHMEAYNDEIHRKPHIVLTPEEDKIKTERLIDMIQFDIDLLEERFDFLSSLLHDKWETYRNNIKLIDIKMELRALNKEIIAKKNLVNDRKFNLSEKSKK